MDDEFDPDFDDEDDDNLEESFTDDEDDYEDEEEPEARRRSPRNQRQDPRLAELQSKLDEANAKVADLNKRLGDQVRINGERQKEQREENDKFFEGANTWYQDQAQKAAQSALEYAVKTVEDRLLDHLLPEEKAAYLTEMRRNPLSFSPQIQTVTPNKNRSSSQNTTEDVSELVALYESKGVPLDKIEQTSAKAVVESATKWLDEEKASQAATTQRRVRDESGATRVSSSGAGVRAGVSDLQKQLDQVNERLRALKGKPGAINKAAPLLERKRALEARLRSRRPAA